MLACEVEGVDNSVYSASCGTLSLAYVFTKLSLCSVLSLFELFNKGKCPCIQYSFVPSNSTSQCTCQLRLSFILLFVNGPVLLPALFPRNPFVLLRFFYDLICIEERYHFVYHTLCFRQIILLDTDFLRSVLKGCTFPCVILFTSIKSHSTSVSFSSFCRRSAHCLSHYYSTNLSFAPSVLPSIFLQHVFVPSF